MARSTFYYYLKRTSVDKYAAIKKLTIKIVNERTVVEVFSYNKMKNIFKGYVDSLPQEILNMDIKTFNIKDNTLILNVEE